MRRLLCLFCLLLFGCTKLNTLNLKPHDYGEHPDIVIWLQVAGLSEEHLALLRFSKSSTRRTTSFEKVNCIGKLWRYNLFELRPSEESSFMAQITGSKNIKRSCEDYEQKPIWKWMQAAGYSVGLFENRIGRLSQPQLNKCSNQGEFYKNAVRWTMSTNKSAQKDSHFFHSQEKNDFESNINYFDKSCSTKGCYSSFSSNVISVYKRFASRRSLFLFQIRDYSYSQAIQTGKIVNVQEALTEIEKIYEFFSLLVEKQKGVLLLLSTSSPIKIDLPQYGREWNEFEKAGRHVIFGKPSLVSSVFAYGVKSENFCGLYEEAELLSRILGPFGREQDRLRSRRL